MQKQPTLSLIKIFSLAAFIIAAIMTSLFVFHMRHSASQPVLTDEEGIIFSVPRDIKSFNLTAASGEPFTLQNLQNHWTLLYFGFTHCSTICPITLGLLKRVYVKSHLTIPNLQVVFVSLDPERDTGSTLRRYTSAFNPDFVGVYGKAEELRKLQSQFGIYSARDNTTGNYQIQHTANILLIDPQGKWAGIYRNELPPEKFIPALEKGIQSLSN